MARRVQQFTHAESASRFGLIQASDAMQKVLGALIIAAVVVGTASGVLFLGVVGALVSVPLALGVARPVTHQLNP